MTTAAVDPAARRERRAGLLPGWAISLVLHAGLLFFALTQLQSCTGADSDGEGTEGFREVGIRLRPAEGAADSPNAASSPAPPSPAPDPVRPTADPLSIDAAADAAASSVAATVPDAARTLGPGALSGGAAAQPGGGFDAPTGPVADPGSLSGAAKRGVTEFFGIRAEAETFVYVIDKSGSMDPRAEFAVAKRELLSSLATLGPRQRFQILFFSDAGAIEAMEERARKEDGFYFATGFNKTLAGQFVGSVSPGGGTDLPAALERALELRPDAIFLLTDGEQKLYAGDYAAVRSANRSGTRIHCVKFGSRRELTASAVAKLAAEHGGGYQYRDVKTMR